MTTAVADYTKIGDLEMKARALLSKVEWSPDNVVICKVFLAMWASALTVDEIEAIGKPMFGLSSVNLGLALTRLVRAGVLRSRLDRGHRRYELNY